jgi:hypothetical protein
MADGCLVNGTSKGRRLLPISYERDDVRQRIHAVGQGSFVVDDVLEVFQRMRAEGVWGYAVL